MSKKLQFQNLALQQSLQSYTQQPTVIQPAVTLPIKPEMLVPLPPAMSLFSKPMVPGLGTPAASGQTGGLTLSTNEIRGEIDAPEASENDLLLMPIAPTSRKKKLLRSAVLLVSALLALAIYFTWHSTTPTSASPTITQQTYSSLASPQPGSGDTPTPTSANTNDSSTIQVYIVGAIKHPGVYTLPTDARVYQLIQAAGGTLPGANLVAINLAAKLTDGQEIYVLSVGETPPAYTNSPSGPGNNGTPAVTSGQPVNINTATETEMEQTLHVSAATAKKIIDYRTQHGLYTAIDQLLQVISQSIFDRIKNMVTV